MAVAQAGQPAGELRGEHFEEHDSQGRICEIDGLDFREGPIERAGLHEDGQGDAEEMNALRNRFLLPL